MSIANVSVSLTLSRRRRHPLQLAKDQILQFRHSARASKCRNETKVLWWPNSRPSASPRSHRSPRWKCKSQLIAMPSSGDDDDEFPKPQKKPVRPTFQIRIQFTSLQCASIRFEPTNTRTKSEIRNQIQIHLRFWHSFAYSHFPSQTENESAADTTSAQESG